MPAETRQAQQLDEVLRRDRIASWAGALVIAALLVVGGAALFARGGGIAEAIAIVVIWGALLVAIASATLWVVGELRTRAALKRVEMVDVTDLMDEKRWPEAIARLEIGRSSPDPATRLEATNLLADAYAAVGRNADAEAMIRTSLEADDQAGETLGEQLTCLAVVVRRQGRTDEAEELFARALDVLRKKDDKEALVFALRNVAYLYWSIGRMDRANEIYDNMPECDLDQLEFLVDILKPFEEPAIPRQD